MRVLSLGREDPPGGHGNLLQYSCLENPHGHRSMAGYNSIGSQRGSHDWIDLTHNLVQEYLWNYKMWFLLSTNINSICIQWRNGKLHPRSLESSLLSRICRVHSDPFRTSYATSLISCFHPNTHWTHCDSLNLPYAPPKFSCLWLKCLL